MNDIRYQCCPHCDHDLDPSPHRQPCNGDNDQGCEQGSAVVRDGR